ncbi:MAG: cytochrome c biogenesis protein CcdA [Candidatus Marinimicrobia bacterium]|jgi:thiol:disulfide interchange protein DsbD|nr:cytochrome c biogenesis protein CcdA [Candidatus Neomarinimicrobiota bacterium]
MSSKTIKIGLVRKLMLIGFFLGTFINGQNDFENAVKYSLNLDRDEVHSGEVVTLSAKLKIAKDFYVYSTHPEKSLSPSYIEWEDSSFFSNVGILQEPSSKTKYDPMFKMDIGYHTSQVQFRQDLKINEDVKPGLYPLNGTFVYQACDPTKCIPHWDDFTVRLTVMKGEADTKYITSVQSEFENIEGKTDAESITNDELDSIIQEGLFSFILFALSMGFLALLTPCVFPMIPITVSFFTKAGEKEDSSPLFSALVYTIGIIVIFTSLGLILALTLGAAGANQLASNPWVNIFIAALFIYFAFSLFGHYEIQLPSAIRQFSSQQEQKGGVLGILFMALTFTLTSFTCTVQFVGLLLVAASQGDYLWPILGMVVFSTAFAFPFFFLALFPQYLAKLPKSGGWLNSVKVTMGFLELGAAMKFISNADLVWQWGIFTKQVVLAVWVIISIMMGFYLLGKIKLPHDSDISFVGVPRLVLSIVFMSFGLYLTGGLFGQPLHGLIDSYLPPVIDASRQNILSESGEKHIVWLDNLPEALEVAKVEKKPVFIDFTGYTCTNCRWMETNVFEEPEVQKLFNEFVMLRLYTDGGENYRENQKMEISRFGTAALPFYVVLSPDDEEISRFPGMDPDASKFVDFLEKSLN